MKEGQRRVREKFEASDYEDEQFHQISIDYTG